MAFWSVGRGAPVSRATRVVSVNVTRADNVALVLCGGTVARVDVTSAELNVVADSDVITDVPKPESVAVALVGIAAFVAGILVTFASVVE